MDVVTFGETMILMTPMNQGSLDTVWQFQKGLAGAESNVAIVLARLDHAVAWVSKLGADSFGRFMYNTLRGEGVDVSHVQFDALRPTGVFFKEFLGGGRTHAYYYRQNSAASQMHVDDISLADFTGARYLVVTGITPALSALNRDTTFQCIEQAHHCGMHVVFDPNIRRKLWTLPPLFLNKETVGAGIGLINALGNLGGFLGPFIIGYFITASGTSLTGIIILCIALVSAGLMLLLFHYERPVAPPERAVAIEPGGAKALTR